MLLGTALSVSAIPVIAKILTEMGLLHRNIGQLILAVGSTNDAVAWVLLSVTSSMATVGLRSDNVAAALIATVGAIGVAVFVLKPLIGRCWTNSRTPRRQRDTSSRSAPPSSSHAPPSPRH
ncbi:cation:proton antiporter [Gordonia polyisoprenivorans]|uniref:cation:proton antiporter domain-containing protein n=1 Tax=Gordonia polyisoprenivorans TaxID=84595 RepID=UPI0023679BB9|nr:cation:proton antiporter [Gordonia polyisoprenivorans]